MEYHYYHGISEAFSETFQINIICMIFLQRGAFVSEPAILVKRNSEANQVWSMEKLDLKLIDMRELYEYLKVSIS